MMAGFGYTIGEIKVMPTVAYLNEIVLALGVLSWSGQVLHMAFSLITSLYVEENLNAQRYRDEILAMPVILLFQNNVNIAFWQDDMISHSARDTMNFLRAYFAFINDWPAKSCDLHPVEHFWDNFDQRVRHRSIPASNVIQLKQALIQEWSNILQAEISTLICSMCQLCQTVLHAEGGHIWY